MARPKKYSNGSKVISYRVPVAAEAHIRNIITNAIRDWNRPTNELKPFEQPKTNYSVNLTEEVSKDAIKAAIDRLQKELNDCPKSYSEMGKIMWAKERNKKIELLKNQLK